MAFCAAAYSSEQADTCAAGAPEADEQKRKGEKYQSFFTDKGDYPRKRGKHRSGRLGGGVAKTEDRAVKSTEKIIEPF